MVRSHIGSTRDYGVVFKLEMFSHLSYRSFGLSSSIGLGYRSFGLDSFIRLGHLSESML